jgi:hypothetical protein
MPSTEIGDRRPVGRPWLDTAAPSAQADRLPRDDLIAAATKLFAEQWAELRRTTTR